MQKLLFLVLVLVITLACGAEIPHFNLNNITTASTEIYTNPSCSLQNGYLSLTTDSPRQVGTAFFHEPVIVLGLVTNFQFQIPTTVTGYEGFTFIITNSNKDSVGPKYGGLGYGDVTETAPFTGIANSLVVEFDTFQNTDLNDPTAPHVSVHSKGVGNPNSANEDFSLKNTITVPQFVDGKKYNVRVEVTPATLDKQGELKISMARVGDPLQPVIDIVPFDLRNYTTLTDPNKAYIGFTASNGETAGDVHNILSWAYNYTGTITAKRCVVSGNGLQGAGAGQTATVDLQAVDQFGYDIKFGGMDVKAQLDTDDITVTDNGDGTYEISYSQTKANNYELHIKANGEDVPGSPFDVTIAPGQMNEANSHLDAPPTGDAGEEITVVARVQDEYKNNLHNLDPNNLRLTQNSGPQVNPQITWNEFMSEFDIKYTPDKEGVYEFVASYQFTPVGDQPASTTITALTEADPHRCSETAPKKATAGQPLEMLIELRDKYGNHLLKTPDNLDAKFEFKNSVVDDIVPIITNQTNGTVHVQYTATLTGEYFLHTKIEKTEIGGSPSRTYWQPALPVASHCTASGEGLKLTEPGILTTFTIQTYDEFFNHLDRGGATINVEMTSPKGTVFGNVKDENNGTYTVEYSIQTAATYTVSITLDNGNGQAIPIKGSPFSVQVYTDQTVLMAVGFSLLGVCALAFLGYRYKKYRKRQEYAQIQEANDQKNQESRDKKKRKKKKKKKKSGKEDDEKVPLV